MPDAIAGTEEGIRASGVEMRAPYIWQAEPHSAIRDVAYSIHIFLHSTNQLMPLTAQ